MRTPPPATIIYIMEWRNGLRCSPRETGLKGGLGALAHFGARSALHCGMSTQHRRARCAHTYRRAWLLKMSVLTHPMVVVAVVAAAAAAGAGSTPT